MTVEHATKCPLRMLDSAGAQILRILAKALRGQLIICTVLSQSTVNKDSETKLEVYFHSMRLSLLAKICLQG